MSKANFHPATGALPEMRPEEFKALCDDIWENGLLEPIWRLPDGRVIDGRHRMRACLQLGIEPEYRETPELEGDELLRMVVSLNLRRRHLTDSQRAMVGARLKPMFAAAAKERMSKGGKGVAKVPPEERGKSRDLAAEVVHVSGRTVEHALKVLKEAIPDIAEAVDSGEIAVSDAALAADYPKREQKRILRDVRDGAKNVKEVLRRIRHEKQLAKARSTPPPKGKFRILVADPPWPYEKTREGDTTQRGQAPYPTMTVEDICELKIPADEDAILWLWCTNAHLADGTVARVLKAWGFTGKTILTWAKPRMGVGDWLRGKTEHCVVASRGRPVHGRPGSDTTLLESPVGEHSAKPDAFYELVERLCPGKKVELFARRKRKGWTSWGAETEGATR